MYPKYKISNKNREITTENEEIQKKSCFTKNSRELENLEKYMVLCVLELNQVQVNYLTSQKISKEKAIVMKTLVAKNTQNI